MKNLFTISFLTVALFFAFTTQSQAQNNLEEDKGCGFCGDMMFLDDSDEDVEASDFDARLKLTVSPSPAQGDLIRIKYENLLATSTVTMYDVNGRPVHASQVGNERDNQGQIKVPVAGLAPGFYIVKLVSGHLSTMKKILIQ